MSCGRVGVMNEFQLVCFEFSKMILMFSITTLVFLALSVACDFLACNILRKILEKKKEDGGEDKEADEKHENDDNNKVY